MAVGGAVGEFDVWLNDKLLSFNTDENVFGSYIRGILEGEESPDEKKEALQGILSEMTEDNISKLCQEILEKWNILSSVPNGCKSNECTQEDVDVKLARIMESQARCTTTRNSNYTDEERRIRQAIISQYSQLPEEEKDEEIGEAGSLGRNTNAQSVVQAEKEKRERSKLESQKKKEKDKEDREKQKQTAADKKEKRTKQKGERRR